jgi:hypothetical protein
MLDNVELYNVYFFRMKTLLKVSMNEMGRTCSTHTGMRNAYRILVAKFLRPV